MHVAGIPLGQAAEALGSLAEGSFLPHENTTTTHTHEPVCAQHQNTQYPLKIKTKIMHSTPNTSTQLKIKTKYTYIHNNHSIPNLDLHQKPKFLHKIERKICHTSIVEDDSMRLLFLDGSTLASPFFVFLKPLVNRFNGPIFVGEGDCSSRRRRWRWTATATATATAWAWRLGFFFKERM